MIGLALSGGGSRAIAFHLGCFRALNDLGLLPRIQVLSTISGGSVIGAYYAYARDRTFAQFETDIRAILRRGFQRDIAYAMLNPANLLPGIAACAAAQLQDVIHGVFGREPTIPRFRSRTDVFAAVLEKKLFPCVNMTSPRRSDLAVVVGACELRTGTAFRFGHEKSGSWRHGELADPNVPVATAVAASAAYPIFLPALDRKMRFRHRGQEHERRVSLTDGGVYDNLGLQVLEPGRDARFSLHTFGCKYLIACNAGQGQDGGMAAPLGFFSRIKRSFEVVHRRVQDGAMHHLHSLKRADRIRGFAMPYLGQQDASLPWRPGSLIPREEVISYPTDFAAMPNAWIDKLSSRGEQLTRLLVSHYLSELLE